MKNAESISGYQFPTADHSHTHAYLMPAVEKELNQKFGGAGGRVFDLGCGNGAEANYLTQKGYELTGVDPSQSGVKAANEHYPNLKIRVGSAYDPLVEEYGTFPAVISLEVVEHVYAPRDYARCVFDLLEPGGIAIISTPYHGYWKNLAMAVSGKMDKHFTALWDHGHIKFWSVKTLTELLEETGLSVKNVVRVGRFPALAKSMILVAERK